MLSLEGHMLSLAEQGIYPLTWQVGMNNDLEHQKRLPSTSFPHPSCARVLRPF